MSNKRENRSTKLMTKSMQTATNSLLECVALGARGKENVIGQNVTYIGYDYKHHRNKEKEVKKILKNLCHTVDLRGTSTLAILERLQV